jgi:hypothetical protein
VRARAGGWLRCLFFWSFRERRESRRPAPISREYSRYLFSMKAAGVAVMAVILPYLGHLSLWAVRWS